MKPTTQIASYRGWDNFDPPLLSLSSRSLWTDYNFQESGFESFGHSGGEWFRGRSSIHLVSREFFRREFLFEAIVFGCIIVASAWPVAYLIETLTGLIR